MWLDPLQQNARAGNNYFSCICNIFSYTHDIQHVFTHFRKSCKFCYWALFWPPLPPVSFFWCPFPCILFDISWDLHGSRGGQKIHKKFWIFEGFHWSMSVNLKIWKFDRNILSLQCKETGCKINKNKNLLACSNAENIKIKLALS